MKLLARLSPKLDSLPVPLLANLLNLLNYPLQASGAIAFQDDDDDGVNH